VISLVFSICSARPHPTEWNFEPTWLGWPVTHSTVYFFGDHDPCVPMSDTTAHTRFGRRLDRRREGASGHTSPSFEATNVALHGFSVEWWSEPFLVLRVRHGPLPQRVAQIEERALQKLREALGIEDRSSP